MKGKKGKEMSNASIKKTSLTLVLALTLLAQITTVSKTTASVTIAPETIAQINPAVPLQINPDPNLIKDIPAPINLQSAAVFAWQEFIALNWPAVQQGNILNSRDTPDTNKKLGDPTHSGPLVWHTFRAKVEIYPGDGMPPGYLPSAKLSYGYDGKPQYIYDPQMVGTATGKVPPGPGAKKGVAAPWINLDEKSEIGLNKMYAGSAPMLNTAGQQILFMAKANRVEYNYVVANGWWGPARFDGNNNLVFAPIINTGKYVKQNNQSPAQNTSTATLDSQTVPVVSFPNGTIEVKAAWRQLTDVESKSGRFYQTMVRYYIPDSNNKPQYVDEKWGLVALHIIQKTPSAPFFVYATFSQADNIKDANGNIIEDPDGYVSDNNKTINPLDPDITSQNATSANPNNQNSIQKLSPSTSSTDPGSRLYYVNTTDAKALPQGKIALNRREHNIPDDIITVNKYAHGLITNYNAMNNIPSSPWLYYKLVNVQYQPYDKPPGTTYTGATGGPDPSTYYQANEVVESDYNLQVFSGQFQQTLPSPNNDPALTLDLITDYNSDGTAFKNVYANHSSYLMGGCMGCHGNAQVTGSDFSFIFLGGPVGAPETAGSDPGEVRSAVSRFAKSRFAKGRSAGTAFAQSNLDKFRKLFLKSK